MNRAKRNRINRRKKHQRKAKSRPNKGGVSDARRAEGKRESMIFNFFSGGKSWL